MDAFEEIVSELLWAEGYWVRGNVKVDLSARDKKAIGRPSTPRWEIDIVAYSAKRNELQLIECKSFIDSRGVLLSDFDRKKNNRYKLFVETKLRNIVTKRLRKQLSDTGACRSNAKVTLCLACGKIRDSHREDLKTKFRKRGWRLLDDVSLKNGLRSLADRGYENRVATITAKLLLRKGKLS
jgi:hypothetical protein